MTAASLFSSVGELTHILDKEKKLLQNMFEKRKTLSYTVSDALILTDQDRGRLDLLLDRGVLHESMGQIQLDDSYQTFFENALEIEEISIASVKECIDSLKENMTYFLKVTGEFDKARFLNKVKKALTVIGRRTLRSVIALKRDTDTTYKQEPNFEIKKMMLRKLDEKSKAVRELINQTERSFEDQLFCEKASDPDLFRLLNDVRNDFTAADHNLLDLERQIIEYIRQTDLQDQRVKKLRRIKFLKDQHTWREDTNILSVAEKCKALPMESETRSKIIGALLPSLDQLRDADEWRDLVKKIVTSSGVKQLRREAAPETDPAFFSEQKVHDNSVNLTELWNAFRAQGLDLLSFIAGYDFERPRTAGEIIIVFCQTAALHADELDFTDESIVYENFVCEVIHAKPHA